MLRGLEAGLRTPTTELASQLISRLASKPASAMSVSFVNYMVERFLKPADQYSEGYVTNERGFVGLPLISITEENKASFIFLKFLSQPAYSVPFIDQENSDLLLAKKLISNEQTIVEDLWKLAHTRKHKELEQTLMTFSASLASCFKTIYGKSLSDIEKTDIPITRQQIRSQILDTLPDNTIDNFEIFLSNCLGSTIAMGTHIKAMQHRYNHSHDVLFAKEKHSAYRDFRLALIAELFDEYLRSNNRELLNIAIMLRHAADHKHAYKIEGLCVDAAIRSPLLASRLESELDFTFPRGRRIIRLDSQ